MKTNKRYRSLLNEGPQTMPELGDSPSVNMRRDGVQKFNPSSNFVGSVMQGGGQKTAVYYINGKHDPKTVLKKWLQVNQKTVEVISEWALHQRISSYGQEWKDASRELLGPFKHMANDSGGNTNIEKCPLCGATDFDQLPDHLPCDQ